MNIKISVVSIHSELQSLLKLASSPDLPRLSLWLQSCDEIPGHEATLKAHLTSPTDHECTAWGLTIV